MTKPTPRTLVPSSQVSLNALSGDRLPDHVEHALALVISHVIGDRGAGVCANLCRVLRRYAHTDVTLDNGAFLPAPAPHIDLHGRLGDPKGALRRRGLTTQSLRAEWPRLELTGRAMPLDLLHDLIPVDPWPLIGALIVEGPQVAIARLEMALLVEAAEPIRFPDRRHEPDSRTSDSQLSLLGNAANALVKTLVKLQVRSPLLGPALGGWRDVLNVNVPKNGTPATLTTAPSRTEVRLLWQKVQADIARRLPGVDELGELEAIRRLRPKQVVALGLFTPLRLRVLIILIAVVGSRVGAIPRLRRCDYVRDHRFSDGSRGPAIALRPGKRKIAPRVHWKGLPEGAAAIIDSYLAFMEHSIGPFSPHDEGPLLHAYRKLDHPWQAEAIGAYVGGISGKSPKPALLPRGADPTWGFTAHTFRSWTAQTIRSMDAHDLLAEWRVDATQDWICEALLDHALTDMPSLYGGASKDPDRERLSAIGTRLTWELLTGEAGARRVRDGASYGRALQAQAALSAEVNQLGREVDHAFQSPMPAGEDRVAQLLGRVEQLMHAHALVRRERQAYEQLVAIERELEAIRHDPARLVLVPDDAKDHLINDDLEAIEAEIRAGAGRPVDERRPVAVREWISVQEMRELAAVSAATIPRWLGQGARPPQLPFAPDDPRNPWPPDRVPVDDSLGQRHRRIITAGISETFLMAAAGRIERLEAILATPGPEGWRRAHVEAPLVKPGWLP